MKFVIFPDEVAARVRVAAGYDELIDARRVRVRALPVARERTPVYAQCAVQIDPREHVIETLKERDVPTAVYHSSPPYLQQAFAKGGYGVGAFPQNEALAGLRLSLPMHPYPSDAEQGYVVDVLAKTCGTDA